MMPLFGKERQKQPSEDTGAVRPSGKGPLARIRARLPWGACAQWLRVLSVAFGVVLALIIVAVLPISGVHALFTAKSETATNSITISKGNGGRSAPLSSPSLEGENAEAAEATEDATDVDAESGESEEESEDASETGDESEESAGPSVKQPEGASGTDSSPAKPSRDAAASSEQTTPPTASPSTDTSAEKGEKVVSGAPKAMDTGGGSDDG